jgi:predicted enzyme related to lactoylglutathione lyase
MSRVVHFEIHASDPSVLVAFYAEVFGWKFNRWGEVDYWLVETGTADQPGINGGLVLRRGPKPDPAAPVSSFVCTIEVDSLEATLSRAQGRGAVLALPRMPIAGVGWLAYVKDPDGNLVGVMQPDAQAA